MFSTSRNPARIITGIAVVIAIFVALTLPLGYFLAGYRILHTETEGHAALLSRSMSRLVAAQPKGWRYLSHLAELMSRELTDFDQGDTAAVLLEQDGSVIARTGPPASPFILSIETELFDAGMKIGTIRVEHSLRPLLLETALTGALGLLFAAAILVALRVVPLRALRRTLEELHSARDEVETRARQLKKNNETLQAEITQRAAAESSLRESEAQFRAVTDTANDGIITIDHRGEIVYSNRAAGRIFGYSREELLGRPLTGLLPERCRVAHENERKRFLAAGQPHTIGKTVELTGLKKDGDEFPLEFSLATFQMTGETYFTGFIHDITERKQVEAELAASSARLQAVMDASTQISIIATDSQGLIRVFNSGAERMLGYRAEEMIGKQTPLILHLESELTERGRELTEHFGRSITGSEALVTSARRGQPEEREWTYVCKNGNHLTVSLAVSALHDDKGELSGFLGIAKDITERKRTDAELMRFAGELDQRIFAAAAANDALQRETEEMRRLNEERATLGNMNELLLACASPDEAYDIFGRAAAGLFQSSSGALHIFLASRNQLTPAASWGEWPDALVPFNPEGCWGLRRGHYYLGNGTSTPPCEHAGSVPGGATLCVPLMAYGEVLGVLHLRGTDASTLQSSLQLVTMANDGLALTLANIKLRQTLKEQSIRDPLTGLFNRRYLTETLHREFARAQRTGASLAIVMLDVDHFKRFNDSFGHDAGDAVLKELGSFLRRSVRADDIACRYGGEEFCLVLPQMDDFAAHQRAEAIRAGAAALEVKSDGRLLGSVTLSLGVALFPEDGGDAESLVRAADAALYEAKKRGRNRTVMSRALTSPENSRPADQTEQPVGI